MKKMTLGEKRAAERAKQLTGYDAEEARGLAIAEAARQKKRWFHEGQAERNLDDAETSAKRDFTHEQTYYLRTRRKTITGVFARSAKALAHNGYVIFEHVYKEWIRKKKPLDGVIVDYARLERASRLSNRQVRTWIAWLLDVHLIPVAGSKGGRNVKLQVVPMHYAWKMDEDGEPVYTENLVVMAPSKAKRRAHV